MRRLDLLEELKQDGMQLRHASPEQKEDKELVLAAVSQNGLALMFAGNDLTTDRDVVNAAVSENGLALQYANPKRAFQPGKDIVLASALGNGDLCFLNSNPINVDENMILAAISEEGDILFQDGFALTDTNQSNNPRADKDIVLTAISNNWLAFKYASKELITDKTFIKEMISISPFALQCAPESFRADKDVVRAVASKDIQTLELASNELLADKTFIMEMICISPYALKYAHESLQADKEVVRAAAKKDIEALAYAHESLKGDKDVIHAAAKKDIEALELATENLLIDKTFIMEMISINSFALKYAHESLRGDKDFIRAAAKKDIEALEFASDELFSDKAFIIEMISIHPYASEFAHKSFWADKDFIRVAVSKDIEALEFASDEDYKSGRFESESEGRGMLARVSNELLADKDFIMEMISMRGYALQYAHKSLRNDKDVVRAAASQYIEALEFASNELLADKDFIMEMISIDPLATRYAHDSLQANKTFRLTAVMHDARATTYLIPILNKETDCKEEGRTLLATALASPNPEKPLLRPGREYKRLLTVALSLAIQSNIPCRLSRFLKRYGHGPAYLYHNTLGVAEKDSSESTPWKGYHAAILHAIDTGRLKLVKETLLDQVPSWPEKKVASNDPFLFALWNAVQSIDHTKHPDLYFTLYMHIMDCLSADTEDALHLESALTAIANIIENLKAHVRYVLSDELLKTLETIYDDANMYQRHLTISTDKQGEQAATIVPLRYKPINDLLEKVIGLYELFNGRYKRIARKEHIGTDTPLAAHDLQCAETELRSLQRAIHGEDHRIFNAICSIINPYRDHLSSQSVFANGTSSAIPSHEKTLSEPTQGEAKRQKTS